MPQSSGLSHHQVLASTSRMAVLDLLRSSDAALGVLEVAEHVGLHQNTVRSHLDLLVEAGYAVRRTEAPSGPGRPRVVYDATGAPEGERNYQLLAEVLAQHLLATSERPGEAAANAGRNWAGISEHRLRGGDLSGPAEAPPISEADAVSTVVRMLANIGFAPELSADHRAISLHRCPFRELAEKHPDVVCGAHLGMLQGALAELGAGPRHQPALLRPARPLRHHPGPVARAARRVGRRFD